MTNIPYGRQHITEEDIEAVVSTLQSDYLTQGPMIGRFESKFANYVGAKHAVAVSNGTTALHLAVQALGVKAGQRIITTPLSFVATANCIRYCNAQVTFVDIDPDTLIIDINKVRSLLSSYPRGTFAGIIPVSFAGYPTDMEAFRELADEYGMWLIEDACHAPGAAFRDKQGSWQVTGNGNFADLTIFSFHPVKHIACGEGGMITTNNSALYKTIMQQRTHGITKDASELEENHGGWYYEMQTLGFNYRLPDIACALGASQLQRADEGIQRRREIAKRYDQAFKGTSVEYIEVPDSVQHAYHLYVIKVGDRKGLYDHLRSKGIYAQVHYLPIHLMPYYQNLGWRKGDFPMVEKYYDHCLSIPMYPTLKDSEQEMIINIIKKYTNAKISHYSSPRRQQEIASQEHPQLSR